MDAYIFSTDHAGLYEPYLFVADQNSAKPGHPEGKSWVPWKVVKLDGPILGFEAEDVVEAIKKDGYYLPRV